MAQKLGEQLICLQLKIFRIKTLELCIPIEAVAGAGEAIFEAIMAEEFSPGGESFLLTLHVTILDEVWGDTEMKKNICQN